MSDKTELLHVILLVVSTLNLMGIAVIIAAVTRDRAMFALRPTSQQTASAFSRLRLGEHYPVQIPLSHLEAAAGRPSSRSRMPGLALRPIAGPLPAYAPR
jgi:hypothetical protein